MGKGVLIYSESFRKTIVYCLGKYFFHIIDDMSLKGTTKQKRLKSKEI